MYILLFTQAPIPGCLDGTIIDSRIILVTMYYYCVVMLGYDWWVCMMINIRLLPVGNPVKTICPDFFFITNVRF